MHSNHRSALEASQLWNVPQGRVYVGTATACKHINHPEKLTRLGKNPKNYRVATSVIYVERKKFTQVASEFGTIFQQMPVGISANLHNLWEHLCDVWATPSTSLPGRINCRFSEIAATNNNSCRRKFQPLKVCAWFYDGTVTLIVKRIICYLSKVKAVAFSIWR